MLDNEYQGQNPDVTTDTPVQPEIPTQPDAPVQPPVQPPVQSPVAPDGSYRYVPPRQGQPAQPPYYQSAPQQPVPTPPPAPKKSGRGWVVVVAVLAVMAILISLMSFTFWWLDSETKANEKEKSSQTDADENDEEDDSSKPEIESSNKLDQTEAPEPEVTDDPYCDGGYSTEYIVSKNNASTVVLEMYAETSNYYFGESTLQQVGAASGIVWTADGYIITNCHCVIDEDTGLEFDRIDVILYDGTVYEDAEIIGADESTDLAVIRIDADDLTPAEFGYSSQLAVGSRVVALGNAFGLSWTATQGIVSAKARDVYEDTGYAIPCLQVDAAINSGNSGGPLLNKYGQVVGINSAKIVSTGIESLGFSIPIDEAKPVLESLKQNGYVKGRVSLGIRGKTYDDGFYQGFAIETIENSVGWKNTDTEKWEYATDRMGRVLRMTLIVAVDDVEVVDYGTLRAELAKHKVGDTVSLTLLHYNREEKEVKTYTVEVKLQEQPKE